MEPAFLSHFFKNLFGLIGLWALIPFGRLRLKNNQSETAASNPEPDHPPEPGSAFPPTREGLLSRLRDSGDHESWHQFYYLYWDLIYRSARKYGLAEKAAEEVVQDTFLTLSRTIKDFQYDPTKGSFKSWLMNQIRWRVLDYLKRQSTNVPLENLSPDLFPVDVFERYWDEQWRRTLLEMAFERLKKTMSPRLIQMYQMRVFQGKDASTTAKMLETTRARVHLGVFRVNRQFRKQLVQLQKEGF